MIQVPYKEQGQALLFTHDICSFLRRDTSLQLIMKSEWISVTSVCLPDYTVSRPKRH